MTRARCVDSLGAVMLIFAAAGSAAAPEAVLVAEYPGFAMNFDYGSSDFNGWGYKEFWWERMWHYTGWALQSQTDDAFARFRTTMKGQHANPGPTPMPTDLDWAFSVVWSNHVGTDSTVFEAMGPGRDIVRFVGVSNVGDNAFGLLGGDGSGDYVTLKSFDIGLGATHKLTLHYKADNGLLDFYIDDTLEVADFHGRDGPPYEIHRIQIEGGHHNSPPGDVFDELVIGLANVPAVWILGDATLDGVVDDDDLSIVLANWATRATWTRGDFTGDGIVIDSDLSLLLANWSGLPGGAVPEPATLALLGLIAPALWSARRKI